MKKATLLTISLFLCVGAFAQTPGDSLRTLRLINELIITNPDRSVGEVETSVEKLESIRKNCKNKTLRTKILNYYLDVYNYYYGFSPSPIAFHLDKFARDEYDAEAKEKLMRLLTGEYSKKEVRAVNNADMKDDVHQMLENRLRQLPKLVDETGKMSEQVKDSLTTYYTAEFEKRRPEKITKYNKHIIYAVGWLEMKEAVPVLKQQQEANKNNRRYPNKMVDLALARLGEEEKLNYLRKYIRETKLDRDNGIANDIFNMTIYLCDTTALEAVLAQLDSPNEYYCYPDIQPFPIGNKIIHYIHYLIKNYPYDYYDIGYPCFKDFVIADSIPKTIEWAEANKGKYILNREWFIMAWR